MVCWGWYASRPWEGSGTKPARMPVKRANAPMSVSNILDQLATTSSRPRYAFAVLALLAEQAGPTGKTGPFITDEDEEKLPLREYIGKRLARMSGRDSRRRQLESRIREDLKDVLTEGLFEAPRIVDEKVHSRVRATGA